MGGLRRATQLALQIERGRAQITVGIHDVGGGGEQVARNSSPGIPAQAGVQDRRQCALVMTELSFVGGEAFVAI